MEYKKILKKQKGLCVACGKTPFPAFNGAMALAVDHDHTCCPGERSCGKCIRGLIHSQCNNAIGAAFNDPKILRDLAEYLERKPSAIQK